MLAKSKSNSSKLTGRKWPYLTCLGLHFFLILSISCQSLLSIMAQGYTALPPSLENIWKSWQTAVDTMLGQTLANRNPVRQAVRVYLHMAGIEKGYVLFAPNVPNSYKVVFELHHRDRTISYELPPVANKETGLRLVTLLDHIGRTDYDPLREAVLKMLAYRVWQEHPDATTIRAVFGYIHEPTSADAARGKNESYEFLSAYDFSFAREPANSETH